jgi:hypothetical protein
VAHYVQHRMDPFLSPVSMDPNRYEVSEPELLRSLTLL